MIVHYFVSREDIYRVLPLGMNGAEIGVHRGENAKNLLSITRPSKLLLVDPWLGAEANPVYYKESGISQAIHELIYQDVKRRFSVASNVEVVRGRSLEVLPKLAENYLQWAYLDAEHSYGQVLAELRLLGRVVSNMGCILGHDFDVGEVRQAVFDFCAESVWQVAGLTGGRGVSFLLVDPRFSHIRN